jgi:phosphoglycerol transferase MdoB-like AlkP superfamily enzyme
MIPGPSNRYRVFLWVLGIVLLTSLFTRLGLLWYEGDANNFLPAILAKILAVGLVYDLAAYTWIILPFSLVALLMGQGHTWRKLHGLLASLLFVICIATLVFQSAAEFLFWNEFESRFNFIAVDYLLFTREVVGNIQQSYPLEAILGGIVVVSLLLTALSIRPFWRAAAGDAPLFRQRLLIFIGLSLLPAMTFFGLDETLHKQMSRPATRELASNGTYSLFRAARNNELSYAKYYKRLDIDTEKSVLREELAEARSNHQMLENDHDPMLRHIPARGERLLKNVVLVSIESLGSDYVGAFNGSKSNRTLTPHLDKLARESLIFSHLYATGLRTVRGLEAITASVPPTPGHALPMREHNKGMQTLGQVFEDNGYEALYLYGGYSWFDNMKDFFGGNGYTVIDRMAIPDDQISHETIWGVADEDLYRLSLREMDARYAKHIPFFAHIMTTSNHRPYTYPAGRVSIPSHTGRDGAVQYSDWAIGQFMAEVKKRPWYKDSILVFVADHTSHGRGRIDLPPENFRIPLIIHAPGLVAPGVVDDIASQIDIAPTLLSLLNIAYDSHFFGQDILHEAKHHPRAFMTNNLTIGYMEAGLIVELGPLQYVRVVRAADGKEVPADDPVAAHLIKEAISYYDQAAEYILQKTQGTP